MTRSSGSMMWAFCASPTFHATPRAVAGGGWAVATTPLTTAPWSDDNDAPDPPAREGGPASPRPGDDPSPPRAGGFAHGLRFPAPPRLRRPAARRRPGSRRLRGVQAGEGAEEGLQRAGGHQQARERAQEPRPDDGDGRRRAPERQRDPGRPEGHRLRPRD